MAKKPKFKPRITRVKLNPEQAVLACDCYHSGFKHRRITGDSYCAYLVPAVLPSVVCYNEGVYKYNKWVQGGPVDPCWDYRPPTDTKIASS